MISQYTQKIYRITYIELIRQGVMKAEDNMLVYIDSYYTVAGPQIFSFLN